MRARTSRVVVAVFGLLVAGALIAAVERLIGLTVRDVEGLPISGIVISRAGVLTDPTTNTGDTELLLDPEDDIGEAISLGLPALVAREWLGITWL